MKLTNRLWKAIAWLVSRPWIATALIRFSQLRPFSEIRNQAGVLYMSRWWVFNPYPTSSQNRRRWNLPISIRVHHIVRPDDDRAMHDHPWNARTIILRGWYTEKRPIDLKKAGLSDETISLINEAANAGKYEVGEYFTRRTGDTATLRVGEYHTITDVSEGGVYTLFISGKWRADWGFLVNGVKVWWRTYLYGTPDPKEAQKVEMRATAKGLGVNYADLETAFSAVDYRPCVVSPYLTQQQEADLAEWEKTMGQPFATGGFTGLPAGELPAILERGEPVLQHHQVKGVPVEVGGETVTVMVINAGVVSEDSALLAAIANCKPNRGGIQ